MTENEGGGANITSERKAQDAAPHHDVSQSAIINGDPERRNVEAKTTGFILKMQQFSHLYFSCVSPIGL